MTLKVLGYNICLGGEDRLAVITAVIRAQRSDAVALLEATDRATAATLARDLERVLHVDSAGDSLDGFRSVRCSDTEVVAEPSRQNDHVVSKTMDLAPHTIMQ